MPAVCVNLKKFVNLSVPISQADPHPRGTAVFVKLGGGKVGRGAVPMCDQKNIEGVMDKKVGPRKEKPDPERMAVLRGLPVEIKQQITGEEAQAFLYKEELPDTLLEKLKDYLVPEKE